MAGSQFVTPKPVSPSRPAKRFTLAEANRTLPLVKRVVGDIVKVHGNLISLQDQVASASKSSERDKDQQHAVSVKMDAAVEQLNGYIEELRGIGCELKDFQTGLVDFIGRHDGHDVCLCWKLGEESIAYWHEIQAGVAGRQPIAALHEN